MYMKHVPSSRIGRLVRQKVGYNELLIEPLDAKDFEYWPLNECELLPFPEVIDVVEE